MSESVVRVSCVRHTYPDRTQVHLCGLDFVAARGERLVILGPNGCGKTTLIDLLLGRLQPRSGTVKHGTKLEVAHFEQMHDVLDESKTVFENVGEGRETVTVGGMDRHVVGYLRDFLFTPEQIQGPITRLSGGERRRLQLAKVLSRPCNVLVLDEPTNDLDLETLELLEEILLEFEGTLLLVSHDRAFLDNVVTSTLVFEGDGQWTEYVGGYEDWQRQKKVDAPAPAAKAAKAKAGRAAARSRRAGFKEKHELGELPRRIEALEIEKHGLFELMSSPGYHTTPPAEIAQAQQRLVELDGEIHKAYSRWMELEALVADDAG